MRSPVLFVLSAVLVSMSCGLFAAPALAQDYPLRPINIIVPLSAGGGTKRNPEVQKRLIEAGDEAFDLTPAQMAAFLREESQRWGNLIKAVGITAQ